MWEGDKSKYIGKISVKYENFRLYCKKIYVNMDCNWVCRDHFLYQYLPKIQLPKGNTGLQNLT